MDGPNRIQRCIAFRLGPVGQREHRFDCVAEARKRSSGAAAKPAVFGYAGGNQWMGELKKHRPQPGNQQQPFGVDAAGYLGGGAHVNDASALRACRAPASG
jgi:hypothetical protein